MAIVGHGRILVWEGASLWVFSVSRDREETDFHTHHAIQLTFALEGGFELRTRDEMAHGPAVAVAADCEHQFAAGGVCALLFVEPDGALGRSLQHRWFEDRKLRAIDVAALQPTLADLSRAYHSEADDLDMMRIGKAIIASLSKDLPNQVPDRRVRQMIDYVARYLDGPISLPAAASSACLSPDRASHLFVEQVGLPFRTYVLWRRVQRAVEIYSGGAPLTAAAHEAGFADSAHLSRTFRRMFGLSAASLRIVSPAE